MRSSIFTTDLTVPGAVALAIQSGRPELIEIYQPGPDPETEAKQIAAALALLIGDKQVQSSRIRRLERFSAGLSEELQAAIGALDRLRREQTILANNMRLMVQKLAAGLPEDDELEHEA